MLDLSALGHLAERRRIDRGGHGGAHRLDRRQRRDLAGPLLADEAGEEVGRVARDVRLGREVGQDVHARIRDHEGLVVVRRLDDVGVAEAAFGAQRLLGDDGLQQLRRVQRALHDRRDPAGRRHLRADRRSLVAVLGVDDVEGVQRLARLLGRRLDPRARADQDGHDHVLARGLDRRLQDGGLGRMDDGDADGRGGLRLGEGAVRDGLGCSGHGQAPVQALVA